jgi:GNAT superfamily N-acetyltransferase
MRVRPATAADAEALARGVIDGVAEYPAFAPAGWTGPDLDGELAHAREVVSRPDAHCLVAEVDGEVVGQITVVPAASGPRPVDDPGLGHLSNLMVRRDHWGSGAARALHAAIVQDSRARGMTALRLFVAAGQARARRFYEREGWRPVTEPAFDPIPGLDMVEYRLTLLPAAQG